MGLPRIVVLLKMFVRWSFVIVVFRHFVACARKVTPFRIIGEGSLERGRVYVAGPHGEQFVFANRY